MKTSRVSRLKKPLVGLGVLAISLLCKGTSAQSLFSGSRVSVANTVISGYIDSLDLHYDNTGGPTAAAATQSFTGLDRAGTTQTMTLTGNSSAEASYGRLHSASAYTVANSYYNAANPIYYNSDTGVVDPNGSPDVLGSDSLTNFTDVLQFGGQLQRGYYARYIFHVDGTNTINDGNNFGIGVVLGIGITNAGGETSGETFGSFDAGSLDTTWATGSYLVNGITPQTVSVDFDTVATTNTRDFADGLTLSGSANFSSTLTLTGIELVDSNGNLASDWTVTSASGTRYNTIQGNAVPEPGSLALLVGVASVGAGYFRRRRSN